MEVEAALVLWPLDIPYCKAQQHTNHQPDQSANKDIAQRGSYRAARADTQGDASGQAPTKTTAFTLLKQIFLVHSENFLARRRLDIISKTGTLLPRSFEIISASVNQTTGRICQ